MTDFDKYIRGRIGKILLELDNQITLHDNCLADIERYRASAENAIFDIIDLGKLEEVYVAGINAGKEQLAKAANDLFKNLPPLPNKSEDKCTLHFVSGCTCPMESTDVYDDDGNYLGYVCLGCGYFSKY